MFKVFSNAWKIADLRKKILYTLMMLLIYRLGCYVPLPGVDVAYISNIVQNYTMLNFLNMFSGGALGNLTMFALGIIPYINASIIMQLLTIALPPLERLQKEGEEGRKKIASITRYVSVALGLFMAIGILISMGPGAMLNNSWLSYATVILCLTAGTALIMWIGERINEKGIGNGMSLLIFTSIVARFPREVINWFGNLQAGSVSIWQLILVVIGAVIIITAITGVDMSERRIPVQYAKRVVGRKMYGGQSTYIPMKVNQSGVLPLIFAITFVQFPAMIGQFFSDQTFYTWYNSWMNSGSWLYIVIYALLILFFTFFYSQISFNPVDVSKNMQQYGGFIPGIRPGKSTSDYMHRILNRITFFGALFLAIVAAVPMMMAGFTGMSSAFGATSLLIMVSVALETNKQIESQMMMRHYKGFLG